MYVHDSLKGYLPSVLTNNFDYLHEIHNYNTHTSALYCVKLPISRTLLYGIHSVKGQSATAWNYLQTNCSADNLYQSHRGVCKQVITQYFIDSY